MVDRMTKGAGRTGIPAGVTIAGEVQADEDLYIDGHVDGQITAPDHLVALGSGATLKAKIVARGVTIAGTLEGSVLATESVRILESASVRAHVTSPALLLVDGAMFTGSVDPERTEAGMIVARYRQRHGEPPDAAK